MTAEMIIARFGGIRPLAKKLTEFLGEEVRHSTVQGWKLRNNIPSRRQQQLLDLAPRCDVKLRPEDFFEGAQAA